ncbi:MAG: DUF58 domain-containing protein, partial [Candidatus Tectomicrobia bacterium]|nr:DUF58 domain-containing protein [Candidatus Tectomicrobia bacterium]
SVELEQWVRLQATLSLVQEHPFMPTRIEWEAPAIAAFRFDHPLAPFRASDAAGRPLLASHAAQAAGLGYFEWTTLHLVVRSRLLLWSQKLDIAIEPRGVRVHPSFRNIPAQEFAERIANQHLLTQGTRQILRGQAADQFHSIRRYQYPDHLRHIDAKKSAKYGQLMTRVYDECRAHHLILALDLGRSMCGRLRNSAKHDYYLSACLMLAQQAIAAGDHVSFFAFANTITYAIRHSRHLASFEPLFKGETRLQARETESRFDLLHPTIAAMSGQRSIVLVLTELTSPSVQQALLEALIPICQRHLTLAVGLQDQNLFLNDLIWDLDPNHLNDGEQARLLYASWLNDRYQLFRMRMSRLGGGVVQGSDATWISLVTQVYARMRASLRA